VALLPAQKVILMLLRSSRYATIGTLQQYLAIKYRKIPDSAFVISLMFELDKPETNLPLPRSTILSRVVEDV